MLQRIVLAMVLMPCATAFAGEKEIAASIAAIRAVGKEGQGNEAAASAWKSLITEGQPLLPTLAGFKDANAYSANWLRSAIDAIIEAEAKAGRKLSADSIRNFVLDAKQSADARRIAFELFEKLRPEDAKGVIAAMIDDPSLELRRDAIARRMELAKDDAALLKPLFAAARDHDQVDEIAKKIEPAPPEDVIQHFNYITRWHVVGPFDGPNATGLGTKYEPENGVDLKASYAGKDGAKASWKVVATKDIKTKFLSESQLVDLTAEIGKIKNAVAYAYAVVEVEKDANVELRGASQNAVKFFVNGKPVFEREAYHQGTTFDQHAGKCTLKAGRNEILVKICQNDQKEEWAQVWAFQMRICDSTGGPVAMTLVSPAATEVK